RVGARSLHQRAPGAPVANGGDRNRLIARPGAVRVLPEPAEPCLALLLDPRLPHRAHELFERIHATGDDLVDLVEEEHAGDRRRGPTAGSRYTVPAVWGSSPPLPILH